MSDGKPLGFVLPPSAPVQAPPSYPGQQQSSSGYPAYPAYPSHPVSQNQQPPIPMTPYIPAQGQVIYQQQPFPAPIGHQQVGFGHNTGAQWFSNTPFQAYLQNATTFHVKQKVELLEAFLGWETPNKYTVKDNLGNKVFYVGENSDICSRQICARSRPFNLEVKDSLGQTVLNFDRPIACSCFCGLFCKDVMHVRSANGQKLGYVEEAFHILQPKLKLKDATGKTVLILEGPMCPLSICGQSVVFRVMTREGVSVGTISKEWSGLGRELFTDADYFNMSFPIDLDPSMKAVCLAALFMIDYEYFEAGHDGHQGGRRLFG